MYLGLAAALAAWYNITSAKKGHAASFISINEGAVLWKKSII